MDFHGNLHSSLAAIQDHGGNFREAGIKEIVIVDSRIDRYEDLVRAAQAGNVGLQFCADGQAALRLARHFHADIWLVSADLPDMSGFDLVEMLGPGIARLADDRQAVTPARPRNRIASNLSGGNSLSRNRLAVRNRLTADLFPAQAAERREIVRPGIFLVADKYRVEDEQRALASGVAGYVVGGMTADGVLATREPSAAVL
jgi:PleD family two-component response regulator